jgi:hypothetical protein
VPTYHWDFFGADAEQTAVHFRRHLDEFLAREGLEGCETGTGSEQAGHHETWCRAPEALEPVLVRSLRPQRKT